jgi:formylglycine-generating enzyme required for sulfatase activity
MKKAFLKIIISLLVIGSCFPGFSQEKDIKMEVFEKVEEVLPFTAVDKSGRAVTDLGKREIVLLVNGRNFRGFSLVYPSARCSQFPGFDNIPKHSCYEITFPYVSEFETFTSIRLGTSRKGVQLHTINTLKINIPQTDITGNQKETPAMKKEKQAIPVEIIEVDTQSYQSQPTTPRLERLGVTKELITQPSFFDVVTHSQEIYKNPQKFWEAVFERGITMIYIPPGEFTMGLPWESGGAEDESPQHKVMLDGYWISKYEITFDQYDQFCRETGRSQPDDYGRGRKKRPVIGICWEDCQAFCQWLSGKTGLHFRLPTEAEWEKAARGTDARKYPWGNDDPGGNHANFADAKFLEKYLELNPPKKKKEREQQTGWINPSIDDGYAFTAPVGSFPGGASPYGVMDMAGNVWEWVQDWYDGDYYQQSPVNNPQKTYPLQYRVSRGGGWDCHPWLLRTTGRAGCIPSKGNDALGFRPSARGPYRPSGSVKTSLTESNRQEVHKKTFTGN